MATNISQLDSDQSLAIRAAWLHFAGGLTQAAVAQRLGMTSVKAHRLIARATADGAVKVTIDGKIAECARLENRLCERFGLAFCEVAPDLEEDGLPLRALGLVGASFLRREAERGGDRVIGVGQGRTLASAVHQMVRFGAAPGVRFVSLLGGFTRNYAANPYDVIHRLAEKTGAPAFVLPIPFFANSVEDREVLLAQRGVKDVFAMSNNASLKLVGIGTADLSAQLVATGMIEAREIAEINAAGGVGEMLGYFFDAAGQVLETTLTARTLAMDLEGPQGARIVGLAGGPVKVAAIRAVLKSGRLSGLITDERTAESLLAAKDRSDE